MKLSKQERELIALLRANRNLPDWAITIAAYKGAWDVYVRGMIGGKRGVGETFEVAWDTYRGAEPEDLPFPPNG